MKSILIFVLLFLNPLCFSYSKVDFVKMGETWDELPSSISKFDYDFVSRGPRVRRFDGVNYFLAIYGVEKTFDANLPTHIIVAGYGNTLKNLFQQSAAARARKLNELYPKDQILLVTYNEIETELQRQKLLRWNFKVIKESSDDFDVYSLADELKPIQKIASLDIFSHSSVDAGALLGDDYMVPYDRKLKFLKDRFLPGAFAVFFGCNSGYELAPYFSKLWNIPVFGSLTSTHFDYLHSSGQFYMLDDALKPPAPWSTINRVSYKVPASCALGACLRMTPDNRPYDGHWGKYDNGLPFYKIFCVNQAEKNCYPGIVKGVISQITTLPIGDRPSFQDYKKAAREQLCPASNKSPLEQNCAEALIASETSSFSTYSPFLGSMIQCDLNGCDYEKNDPAAFVREYQLILRAYQGK